MKLSEVEVREVEKLRKRQQQFRRWRYPLVILHGLLVVAWFALLLQVIHFPSDNITAKLIVVSYTLPGLYLMMAFSAFPVWLHAQELARRPEDGAFIEIDR